MRRLPVRGFSRAMQTTQVRLCSAKATGAVAQDDEPDFPAKPAATRTSPMELNKFTDGSGFGSVSPWAVFADVPDFEAIPEEERDLLSPASVAIPMSEKEESTMPGQSDILKAYETHLQRRSMTHLGYPYNLTHRNNELATFMQYSINNLGDPFEPSNYGVHSRQFEVAVIDFFAKLWKCDEEDYWGYVTTCGTEGNLHAMLLARECHPTGIVYTSKDTHYSIFKAAKYYKMDAVGIPSLPMGEIDYDELSVNLVKNKGRLDPRHPILSWLFLLETHEHTCNKCICMSSYFEPPDLQACNHQCEYRHDRQGCC